MNSDLRFHRPHLTGPRFALVLGILAVFWLGQSLALVHETEHPFHEHSVECDLYQGLSQPLSTDGIGQPPMSALLGAETVSVTPVLSRLFSEPPVFRGRAPPLS
jgi:hypothetical protein